MRYALLKTYDIESKLLFLSLVEPFYLNIYSGKFIGINSCTIL